MLSHLSISNFALIDSIEVSFKNGFNIITGETGSGKSIIIGALGLVLGERADSSSAKDKSKKCIIEATFDLSNFNLSLFFDEQDLDYESLTVVRREINQQGKSRAFINDTPVNLNVLKAFSTKVIDVHSQHKTIELSKQSFQLDMVDALADTSNVLIDYKVKFKQFTSARKELEELIDSSKKSKADEDYLTFVLSEFEGLKLDGLDQEELESEQNLLENSEEIKSVLSSAINRLDYPEIGILSNLNEVLSELSKISNYNKSFEELNQRIDSSLIELRDVQAEIESIESTVEHNPNRLDEVNEILGNCYQLQRKHALNSISELIEFKENISKKLNQVSNADNLVSKKEKEIEGLKKEAIDLAKKLSDKRNKAFDKIEIQVNQMLEEVAMPSAKLSISSSIKELSSDGVDDLVFLIKTNKGTDFKSIQDIASGGEMSRIMLVLKTILSQYNNLPTIIFDEIDTGISGEVADKVGEVMRKLSKNIQVFSITHLPQVASKGKQHYYVYKSEDKDSTNTHIKLLSQDDRVVEIAKMMSGEKPTESSLKTAKELLN